MYAFRETSAAAIRREYILFFLIIKKPINTNVDEGNGAKKTNEK